MALISCSCSDDPGGSDRTAAFSLTERRNENLLVSTVASAAPPGPAESEMERWRAAGVGERINGRHYVALTVESGHGAASAPMMNSSTCQQLRPLWDRGDGMERMER